MCLYFGLGFGGQQIQKSHFQGVSTHHLQRKSKMASKTLKRSYSKSIDPSTMFFQLQDQVLVEAMYLLYLTCIGHVSYYLACRGYVSHVPDGRGHVSHVPDCCMFISTWLVQVMYFMYLTGTGHASRVPGWDITCIACTWLVGPCSVCT